MSRNGKRFRYYLNTVYADNGLEYALFDEGRLLDHSGTFKYEYFLKDHLGNTRVTFSNDDNNSTIELEQEDHYYPFGMNFTGVNGSVANPVNKYKYNGKELQDDHNLNWYDYGWRMYDPTIARWNGVDNLAEQYYSISTYHYAGNNPIRNIDIDGNEFTDAAWEWVDKLITDINSRKESNNEEIADNKTKLMLEE